MKKFFAFCSLAACLLFAVCPAAFAADCAHTQFANGICSSCGEYQQPEKAGGVYQIENAGQFAWFSEQVNAGNTDIDAALAANIDLSPITAWVPAGTADHPYRGVFEGNFHTISNLSSHLNQDNVGLFGTINGAELKNFTVSGSVSGGSYVAGICGSAVDSVIQNVVSKVSVTASGSMNGGIAGRVENTSVTSCQNSGTISGGLYQNGGIVGQLAGGRIERCLNTGDINVQDHAAGIVAWIESGTVIYCMNTGDVTNTNGFYTYIAGIAAENRGTVSNCLNTGTVTGNAGYGCIQAGTVAHQAGTSASTTDCYTSDGSNSNAGYGTQKPQDWFFSEEAAAVVDNAFSISESGEPVLSYRVTYTGAYTGTEFSNANHAVVLPQPEHSCDIYYFSVDGEAWDGTGIFSDLTVSVSLDTVHSYGSWVTETPAAVGSEGLRYRECSVCGDRITETIPALEPGETVPQTGRDMAALWCLLLLSGAALAVVPAVLGKKQN